MALGLPFVQLIKVRPGHVMVANISPSSVSSGYSVPALAVAGLLACRRRTATLTIIWDKARKVSVCDFRSTFCHAGGASMEGGAGRVLAERGDAEGSKGGEQVEKERPPRPTATAPLVQTQRPYSVLPPSTSRFTTPTK